MSSNNPVFNNLETSIASRFAELNDIPPHMAFGVNSSLPTWGITLSITKCEISGPRLSIEMSENVAKAKVEPGRIPGCLQAWVPTAMRIHIELGICFRLRLSAGDEESPGFLSMDAPRGCDLMPDMYSLGMGYGCNDNLRGSFSEFRSEWLKRKPIMFWRGSTTGRPGITGLDLLAANRRVNACLSFARRPCFDIKITNLAQVYSSHQEAVEFLEMFGVIAEQVPEDAFKQYRYYPDLPGNVQAWGSVRKMADGCLIFRPQSQRFLHYYKFIQPWKHYIPVEKDLENLEARRDWAEGNIEAACLIAWRGSIAARRYISNVYDHLYAAFCDALEVLPL